MSIFTLIYNHKTNTNFLSGMNPWHAEGKSKLKYAKCYKNKKNQLKV